MDNKFLILAISKTLCFNEPIETEKLGNHISSQPPQKSVVAPPSTPTSLLERETSPLIYGCVNVISGEFCDFSIDLTLTHGVDPLPISRSFISTSPLNGTLGTSWFCSCVSVLEIKKDRYLPKVVGKVLEGNGNTLPFQCMLPNKKISYPLILYPSFLENGVTTTPGQAIFPHLCYTHFSLVWTTPRICALQTGSYAFKQYSKFPKERVYHLRIERLDSGNFFTYSYMDHRSHLEHVAIVNKGNKTRALARFSDIDDPSPQIKIEAQDGRFVTYSFGETKEHTLLLSQVKSSDKPTETYTYQRILDPWHPGIRYITSKSGAEGRGLKIEYYDSRNHIVRGKTIALEARDPRFYRVRSLIAPAGENGEEVPLYQFIYHLRKALYPQGMLDGFLGGECEVYDALGHKTLYTFNENYRLTKITTFDEAGEIYSQEKLYWGDPRGPDATHLLLRSFLDKERPLFAHTYKYDTQGNRIEHTIHGNLSGKNRTPLQLDKEGFPVDNQCERFTTFYTYSQDGRHQLLQEKKGNQVTSYTYYPRTMLLAEKFEGDGERILKRTFYTYNKDGALLQEIVDDGSSKDRSDLSSVSERSITRYTLSNTYPVGLPLIVEKWSLVEGKEVLSKKVIREYTSRGRVTKEILYDPHDQLQASWSGTYDDQGHLIEEIDSEGKVISYKYDANGNCVECTEKGVITTYKYDLMNRLIFEEELDSEGVLHTINHRYDPMGNRVGTTDACGNIISYTYDTLHRLVETLYSSPKGEVERVVTVYDPMNHPIATINSQGETTKRSYTIRGDPTLIIYPDGSEEEYLYHLDGSLQEKYIRWMGAAPSQSKYDSKGRLIECIEALGSDKEKKIGITYNDLGQKETLTKNDGTVLTYRYTKEGLLHTLHSSDGSVNDLYDEKENIYEGEGEAKRLAQEVLSNGLKICYSWDEKGRLQSLTLPDLSSITYMYEEGGNLKTITRKNPEGVPLYTHTYTSYDAAGHPLSVTTAGLEEIITYTYNEQGQLNLETAVQDDKVMQSSTAVFRLKAMNGREQESGVYNSLGNLISRQIGEKITHYEYDSLHQLQSEESHSYLHDTLYRRIMKDGRPHVVNELYQLLHDGDVAYTYDLNGNLIQKGEETYAYDALDRLTTYTKGNNRYVYLYDERNRRVSRLYHGLIEDEWRLLHQEHFLYQGLEEIGTVDEEGNIVELRLLGPGRGGHATVAIELEGSLFIPTHDISGNITGLIDGTTGQLVESYRYTAFGEVASTTHRLNPWGFAGKRHDKESELIYFGRRYYAPDTGRWITPDPSGLLGGANSYAYGLNNPLTTFDPYGLFSLSNVSSLFTSLASWIKKLLCLPGNIIEFLSYHLLPIPYIKEMIEFAGWCLGGKDPSFFLHRHERPHSKLIKEEGYGYGNPRHRHILYCGIGVSEGEFRQRLKEFSGAYGGITVWGVYNNSQGFLLDTLEVILQKLGVPVRAQQLAEQATKAIINTLGPYKEQGVLFVEAHSQGAETVHNLSPELKKMMHVIGLGPARFLSPEDFRSVSHYVNRFDPVPFADPIGLFQTIQQGNLHYLPSTGCPIVDHLYDSKNFNLIRQMEGGNYRQTHGWISG